LDCIAQSALAVVPEPFRRHIRFVGFARWCVDTSLSGRLLPKNAAKSFDDLAEARDL
jgi:hypothetical protein